MTILEMLGQSGVIALLGMGIVFSFLVVLVIAISLLGKVIGITSNVGDADVLPAQAGTDKNNQVIAVISAAVNEYRREK
ncbi:MAG: OadG family protein [Treponema sp.]|nr:OadG family protein [Treponema sp.]